MFIVLISKVIYVWMKKNQVNLINNNKIKYYFLLFVCLFFKLGFVLYVINQHYIQIYLLINFLLMLSENVHQMLKLLNMKLMDNGNLLEKKNHHDEHNEKKKLIKQHKQQKLQMENQLRILIIHLMTTQRMNDHEQVNKI